MDGRNERTGMYSQRVWKGIPGAVDDLRHVIYPIIPGRCDQTGRCVLPGAPPP